MAIQNLNGERWLADALASVESVRANAPAGSSVLAVLMDAGSTDGSLDIAARFPGIEVMRLPGASQAAALNAVLKSKAGQYDVFGWTNCDDYLLPTWASSHQQTLAENPGVDLLHSPCLFWDESTRCAWAARAHGWETAFREGANAISQPTVCIPAATFTKFGVFDESFRYAFDFEFTSRVWKRGGKIVVTPEPTAFYRVRQDNLTHTKTDEIRPEVIRVKEMWLK